MYALTPYPITPIGNFMGGYSGAVYLSYPHIRKLSLAVWGLCFVDRRVLFPDVREHHCLA